MSLFRPSKVDEIVDAESDLELAQMTDGQGLRVVAAQSRATRSRRGASFAENMQADYEVATGDRDSRVPFSGVRRLSS